MSASANVIASATAGVWDVRTSALVLQKCDGRSPPQEVHADLEPRTDREAARADRGAARADRGEGQKPQSQEVRPRVDLEAARADRGEDLKPQSQEAAQSQEVGRSQEAARSQEVALSLANHCGQMRQTHWGAQRAGAPLHLRQLYRILGARGTWPRVADLLAGMRASKRW